MFLGLLFALIACFIWGTIFVIPHFLPDFSALEVGLGRYFGYGLFSIILFLRRYKRYPWSLWKKAFMFALFANIFYYPPLVLGLRFATAPVTILVVSLCPILIALYGNFQARECRFRDLFLPCVLILLGIFLVNISEVDWSFTSSTPGEYLLGLAGALCALASWTFFAVQNARFLKKNSDLVRTEWVTLIGVATLILTVILFPLLSFIKPLEIDLAKFITPSEPTLHFFLAIMFMGIVCSWIGSYLWNEASAHLPISLIGPLVIFEMLFGLTFVFLVEKRMPYFFEFAGICVMLWGTLSILYLFRKKNSTLNLE